MRDNVRIEFDAIAKKYDTQRKQLIPCFNDFYQLTCELLDFSINNPNILDLGAGTGLLSSFVNEKYPSGLYTLIDLSADMLAVAKERFLGFKNMEFIQANYVNYPFKKLFHGVVSALSIHHLIDKDKQLLFQHVYDHLYDGGVFVNADQVLAPCEKTEEISRKKWYEYINNSKLTKQEKDAAYERMKLDNMTTLEKTIDMLKRSGFRYVDVYYKYYNFVIIYAVK